MGSTFHSQYTLENTSPSKEARNNMVMHNSKYAAPRRVVNKRKIGSDYTEGGNGVNVGGFDSMKNKYHRIMKRQKNPNEIFGQKLPLNRIIETLDQEKLQNLIINLVTENPELASKVIDVSPKITPTDALNELRRKLELILINIPYKVESTSDYSFLRVKSFVNDFFESLSDYSLNFIAPIETDSTVSITFLKNFLVDIFHKLPKFQAVEFKYFYNLTIEKFNLIFLNNITQFLEEKKQNLLLVINENWLDDFRKINMLNGNNFSKIEVLLEEEINKYYTSGSVILNSEKADVTDNKLAGLDSLLNFAYQNSPLSSTTLNNV